MKYVDEFRDRAVAAALAERIKQTVHRAWTIMEVCGGQTHAIVMFSIESLSPQDLTLVQRRVWSRSFRWEIGNLPQCAHVFVLPDEGVFGQDGRILFSGGCDDDLIRRISVKRLRQCCRSVAECGGERHESELRHLECDTKPFFRIAGNPYPFFLQQLTELPRRYH